MVLMDPESFWPSPELFFSVPDALWPAAVVLGDVFGKSLGDGQNDPGSINYIDCGARKSFYLSPNDHGDA